MAWEDGVDAVKISSDASRTLKLCTSCACTLLPLHDPAVFLTSAALPPVKLGFFLTARPKLEPQQPEKHSWGVQSQQGCTGGTRVSHLRMRVPVFCAAHPLRLQGHLSRAGQPNCAGACC
jgi:hypothetical protein